MASRYDVKMIAVPIVLVCIWVAAYLALDILLSSGNTRIILSPILFATEFAVIFVLSIYLSGTLSLKSGLKISEVLIYFLIFFLFYLAASFLTTLSAALIYSSNDLLGSVILFFILGIMKLIIGLVGVLIGAYLYKVLKSKDWESYRTVLMGASVLIFLAVIGISYLAGLNLSQSIKSNSSPDFSDTIAQCNVGSWDYFSIYGNNVNLTVQGVTTYRGREVCHTSGNGTALGKTYYYDDYRVTTDDYCTVTTSNSSSVNNLMEKCYGNWPGYVSSG